MDRDRSRQPVNRNC